jgi:hypothetical protein
MSGYLDLAARELEKAEEARQRAKRAREESAHAVFHDTAVELAREAAEAERAARHHLETARRFERLADQEGGRNRNGGRTR